MNRAAAKNTTSFEASETTDAIVEKSQEGVFPGSIVRQIDGILSKKRENYCLMDLKRY
jgi:hypothetical protein